jgi:hypothetical protein
VELCTEKTNTPIMYLRMKVKLKTKFTDQGNIQYLMGSANLGEVHCDECSLLQFEKELYCLIPSEEIPIQEINVSGPALSIVPNAFVCMFGEALKMEHITAQFIPESNTYKVKTESVELSIIEYVKGKFLEPIIILIKSTFTLAKKDFKALCLL